MTTKATPDSELARQQFAMLCDPVKHYLTDKIGMDELNAGLMAANIVEAQQQTVLNIAAQQRHQILTEVRERLPEKKPIDYCPSENCHFNTALTQVETVLEEMSHE